MSASEQPPHGSTASLYCSNRSSSFDALKSFVRRSTANRFNCAENAAVTARRSRVFHLRAQVVERRKPVALERVQRGLQRLPSSAAFGPRAVK